MRNRGTDYLYFALLDVLSDRYYGIVEDLSQEIEYLENTMLQIRDQKGERIHGVKKSLIWIRNGVFPGRDIVRELTQTESSLIKDETRVFFEDLLSHLDQIVDMVGIYREIAQSLNDTFDGLTNQQMNRIMTILTIFSAVFIPLSFLAGVFGMNFVHMPIFEWTGGVYFFVILCIALASGMLGYFKYQKWL
ncbi:MAG: hypothetical protein AVO33_09400 [delta proteobacterium ML8_F1]|nr:MAG: hypothetical protein AVO33_09400 [delta proteobacterium ML8_F1]